MLEWVLNSINRPLFLPTNLITGKIRGWAFGEDRTIACANVDGQYYAVEGQCPRCAFDLYKGKLLVDADVWGPEPRVACPTCSVTYSLKTGKFGPEYKATGLAGFVNSWAKTATVNNASQDVGAFIITRDEDTGKVFCRERWFSCTLVVDWGVVAVLNLNAGKHSGEHTRCELNMSSEIQTHYVCLRFCPCPHGISEHSSTIRW